MHVTINSVELVLVGFMKRRLGVTREAKMQWKNTLGENEYIQPYNRVSEMQV